MRPEHVIKSPILASLTVCGDPGALPGTPGEACIHFRGCGRPWPGLGGRSQNRPGARLSAPLAAKLRLPQAKCVVKKGSAGFQGRASHIADGQELSLSLPFSADTPRSSTSAPAATPADSPGRRRPAIPAQHPSNGDRATVDENDDGNHDHQTRGGAPFLLHPNLKTGYLLPRPLPC